MIPNYFLGIIVALTLILSNGCASREPPVHFEDRFDSTSIAMQHMQYFATAHLTNPADHEAAVNEITAFLSSKYNGLSINGPEGKVQPPLRKRDFWAIILAHMKNQQFEIMAQDDMATRDKKISDLLSQSSP